MKQLTPEQRVLQKFIDYQQEFKDQTQDYAPGNRYWADKFMTIIGEAKKVLNTAEDEPDMVYCPFCDHEWDCRFSLLCKCSPNQIALRKIEEYLNTKPHPEQMNELHVFYNWLQQEDE